MPRKSPAFKGLKLLAKCSPTNSVSGSRTASEDIDVKCAAADLLCMALKEGDIVDVFYEKEARNRFWEAVVTEIDKDGFWFEYLDDNVDGRVLFSDLHSLWRFHFTGESEHYTSETMEQITPIRKRVKVLQ